MLFRGEQRICNADQAFGCPVPEYRIDLEDRTAFYPRYFAVTVDERSGRVTLEPLPARQGSKGLVAVGDRCAVYVMEDEFRFWVGAPVFECKFAEAFTMVSQECPVDVHKENAGLMLGKFCESVRGVGMILDMSGFNFASDHLRIDRGRSGIGRLSKNCDSCRNQEHWQDQRCNSRRTTHCGTRTFEINTGSRETDHVSV